jgi:hypothetical protein
MLLDSSFRGAPSASIFARTATKLVDSFQRLAVTSISFRGGRIYLMSNRSAFGGWPQMFGNAGV